MIQKAFVFILFMWNSSTSTSQDVVHLRRFSLGCEAVIPCQNNRVYVNRVKWLYKRQMRGEEKTILVIDKGGLLSHGDAFPHQLRVGSRASLIIDSFTEDYEGLYWCVPLYCDPYNCRTDMFRIIRVKKEILNDTFKTVHVSAGDTFAYKCPGKFPNTRWTFETRNNSSCRSLREVTSNKSIHIVNVTTKDAGKYTCSVSKCNRPFVKLLTVTLCVTEHQCKNLSDSCPVCDLILNNTELHNVTNEHSCGSLNCSSDQSTNLTSHTSNNSPGQ
ncbi:uncharacterized protein LOC115435812 [Sphaeramia orbicularis]|uniref:uncharacterized protein LOC115435812 n=1 Tax=Sphaeramia orbicularis TaxID=375764 RepID=UPI00117D18B5|nr:uncharacterized protein LOC115435812 [Sphaeramia orbicularis]